MEDIKKQIIENIKAAASSVGGGADVLMRAREYLQMLKTISEIEAIEEDTRLKHATWKALREDGLGGILATEEAP